MIRQRQCTLHDVVEKQWLLSCSKVHTFILPASVHLNGLHNIHRNPNPRSRPQFGQLVSVLAGNSEHVLGWSDEDKQVCSKEAITFGAPLESANNLYYDLQLTYMHTQ